MSKKIIIKSSRNKKRVDRDERESNRNIEREEKEREKEGGEEVAALSDVNDKAKYPQRFRFGGTYLLLNILTGKAGRLLSCKETLEFSLYCRVRF